MLLFFFSFLLLQFERFVGIKTYKRLYIVRNWVWKKNTTLIVPRLDYNDIFFLFCFVVVVVVVFVALILCAKVLYYMFFVLFWFMCHFVFFFYINQLISFRIFFLLFCFTKNQTSSDFRCCSWCHSLTFCFLIILTQLKAYYGVYLQLALCNFLIFRTNNKKQQKKNL